MIAHYWLEKGISTLLIAIFCILGILSFGYPSYFDNVFIAVLFGLIACYRLNPDLASIGVILLIVRIVNELLFAFDGSYQKLIFYLASLLIVFKFKFDKQISMLLVPLLVICCGTELYWYVVNYQAPQLELYVVAIAINCWLRYLLIYRGHISNSYSNIKLSGISLDFDLYKLAGVANIVVTLMIAEYLIRHLTPMNPLLVYSAYSYLLQLISLLFPYLVISYIIKSRFTIKA